MIRLSDCEDDMTASYLGAVASSDADAVGIRGCLLAIE